MPSQTVLKKPAARERRSPARKISKIVLHCSATPAGMDIGAEEIRAWHTDPERRGGAFDDIGYHKVIRRGGEVEDGRPLAVAGAHAHGHNHDSIGVCLVGGVADDGVSPEVNYTLRQWLALDQVLVDLLAAYPGAVVLGHNQVSDKACPCFPVPKVVRPAS